MWKIIDLEYRLSDGVATNVMAEYRLNDGITISRKIISLELPEPSNNVIPFNELTEEQVIQWVKGNCDYSTIERDVKTMDGRILRVSGSQFRVKILNQTSRAYPGYGTVSGDAVRFSITRLY